jgi:hypothetical protein
MKSAPFSSKTRTVLLNGFYQFRFYYYEIPNTLFGILYLDYLLFRILLYPTGFTHYLYTMDFLVYLEQSITSHFHLENI